MTVQIPMFISSECERLINALPNQHKQKAEEVLKQLNGYISIEKALYLVSYMIDLEEMYVYSHMKPRLFQRSLISQSLIKALKQYEDREEAEKVLNTVHQMANFESSWCQDDEGYKEDRVFNVVTSPTTWRRVCARTQSLPNQGKIEVVLEIKKPKITKMAQNAWKYIAKRELKISDSIKKLNYKIWFRQVPKACYYFYVR